LDAYSKERAAEDGYMT